MSDTLNRFHILNETCANKKASQVWASALQKLEVARLSPRLGEEGFWVHGSEPPVEELWGLGFELFPPA